MSEVRWCDLNTVWPSFGTPSLTRSSLLRLLSVLPHWKRPRKSVYLNILWKTDLRAQRRSAKQTPISPSLTLPFFHFSLFTPFTFHFKPRAFYFELWAFHFELPYSLPLQNGNKTSAKNFAVTAKGPGRDFQVNGPRSFARLSDNGNTGGYYTRHVPGKGFSQPFRTGRKTGDF